jgi:hypothetical protein
MFDETGRRIVVEINVTCSILSHLCPGNFRGEEPEVAKVHPFLMLRMLAWELIILLQYTNRYYVPKLPIFRVELKRSIR